MTINLNLLRAGLVTLFWSILWLGIVVAEKALGWPILTIFGLTMVAVGASHPGIKLTLVGLASFIVAGLYQLPASLIVGWLLMVVSGIGSKTHQRFVVSLITAWLSAIALGFWHHVPSDRMVLVYLTTLVVMSGLSLVYLSRWRPKMI